MKPNDLQILTLVYNINMIPCCDMDIWAYIYRYYVCVTVCAYIHVYIYTYYAYYAYIIYYCFSSHVFFLCLTEAERLDPMHLECQVGSSYSHLAVRIIPLSRVDCSILSSGRLNSHSCSQCMTAWEYELSLWCTPHGIVDIVDFDPGI